MIVALAVVVCLAASSANAAVGITAPIPVNANHPNECLLNSSYVLDGERFQLQGCREMVCDVNEGFYHFSTYTCPPAPPLGDPLCKRVLRDEPYPNCCPHAAYVACS
ncbi:uncharacterized protein LOC143033028 isoform X1 [Oratosquilla oratoria]|uniref:uncharacterized protein LOC143033028 isoform X1 n=1 Tax=Oratosquilla oratoria TaxID=337810 RepID=UPI003F7601FC